MMQQLYLLKTDLTLEFESQFSNLVESDSMYHMVDLFRTQSVSSHSSTEI